MRFSCFAARLAEAALTMLGASLAVFALTMLGTDELARQMITGAEERPVSPEEIAAVTEALGLSDPFFAQFARWLAAALHGDLGWSYMCQAPVADVILARFPATLALAGAAFALTLLVSIPLGLLAAHRPGGKADLLIRGLSFAGLSLPGFWLGLLLLWSFGLKLRLFPIAAGTGGWAALVLPALALAAGMASKYVRQVRAAALEELAKDYVIGAHARGFSDARILFREVLPNALLPLTALFGLSAASLLSGAAVIEAVFGWPGLGHLAVQAVEFRDIRLLQGIAVWGALCCTLSQFAADAAQRLLDPRLSAERRSRR